MVKRNIINITKKISKKRKKEIKKKRKIYLKKVKKAKNTTPLDLMMISMVNSMVKRNITNITKKIL